MGSAIGASLAGHDPPAGAAAQATQPGDIGRTSGRAGLPTSTEPGGQLRTTLAAMPTRLAVPIATPFLIVAPLPTKALAPI
jgi:hypothetical protein